MTIWIAMLLGTVQGLCEFLPVSSSGHLVLMQNVFGISEGALFFDTMVHVGTLIAVIVVYWKDIIGIFQHLFSKKTGMLILAMIPTAAIALLFKDFFVDSYNGQWLGIGFLITGLILTLSDRVRPRGKGKELKDMAATDALSIGLMQGLALMPGISRSGATISGGLFCKLDRRFAADFSFLLSAIAIVGSIVFQIPDLVEAGVGVIDWGCVVIGMGFAALFGFLSIKTMLRLIAHKKLWGFAIYVSILGALVLLDQYVFHVFFTTVPF